MFSCPKFHTCSAPICPLDPGLSKRDGTIDGSATGGVKEKKCKLGKAKRMELGTDLPWRGLWQRELASIEKWEKKTEVERSAQMLLGEKNLDLA